MGELPLLMLALDIIMIIVIVVICCHAQEIYFSSMKEKKDG